MGSTCLGALMIGAFSLVILWASFWYSFFICLHLKEREQVHSSNPAGAVAQGYIQLNKCHLPHPTQDYGVAVTGVKQVSSFSSRKEQAKRGNQKVGQYQRYLKRCLGTLDIQRAPGRGVTEGKAAHQKEGQTQAVWKRAQQWPQRCQRLQGHGWEWWPAASYCHYVSVTHFEIIES